MGLALDELLLRGGWDGFHRGLLPADPLCVALDEFANGVFRHAQWGAHHERPVALDDQRNGPAARAGEAVDLDGHMWLHYTHPRAATGCLCIGLSEFDFPWLVGKSSIISGIMGDTPSLIQIKGIRDGLLITLAGAGWPDLLDAFIRNIDERPAFFQGGRVALDVGALELRVAELSALRDQLSERGIALWAVLSESQVTETTAQNLGLATRISKPQPPAIQDTVEELPAGAAKWVKGPLRSGGRIVYEGNVVVMGDVNPGAEIVASGSIIVWGRLRGVVHAGAQGDEQALVCALELAPTQLRIAGEIAISPKKQGKNQPEVACLRDGQLVAEPWQAG
jgi:septum site-determining protein MinC